MQTEFQQLKIAAILRKA